MGRERIIKRICGSCGNLREGSPLELVEGSQCRFCKASVKPIHEPYPIDQRNLEAITGALDVPVLVEIQLPDTPEARAQRTHLERVARKLDGRGVILTLDADDHRETAWSLGVTTVPTLLVMKRHVVVFTWEGFAESELIEEWMRIAARM